MSAHSARKTIVGRFAPSPTGRMHAGNIFAALMSWLVVKKQGGKIILRIDDLDVERSKASYADKVMGDFELLGLTWDEGPFWQQGNDERYAEAYGAIAKRGLVYPCFCTRADLRASSAPHRGEKAVYAGTCRRLSKEDVALKSQLRNPSWRIEVPEKEYALVDMIQGPYSQVLSRDCGDFVIRRSDGLFAYQLATVVDDADQGVNCIVRGMDLLVSTPQQLFLQEMLGFEAPSYAHIPLIVGEKDRRLSKRDRDAGMEELLARFKTPERVLGHIAFLAGIHAEDEAASSLELLNEFDLGTLKTVFPDLVQIQWW